MSLSWQQKQFLRKKGYELVTDKSDVFSIHQAVLTKEGTVQMEGSMLWYEVKVDQLEPAHIPVFEEDQKFQYFELNVNLNEAFDKLFQAHIGQNEVYRRIKSS